MASPPGGSLSGGPPGREPGVGLNLLCLHRPKCLVLLVRDGSVGGGVFGGGAGVCVYVKCQVTPPHKPSPPPVFSYKMKYLQF